MATSSQISTSIETQSLPIPLLRLFSYQNDSPSVLEKIRLALSKFIAKRYEWKKNSIESKLKDTINNLVNKRQENPGAEEYEGLEPCAFCNEQILAEVKTLVDGIDVPLKSASFCRIWPTIVQAYYWTL